MFKQQAIKMTFSNVRICLYVIIGIDSGTIRAIMALALAQYEDLFELVRGYPCGANRG